MRKKEIRMKFKMEKDKKKPMVNVFFLDKQAFNLVLPFHTFTCRRWQAPRAISLTDESRGADKLQPSITHIADIV